MGHAKDAQQLENIIQSELQNLSDQSKLDKDLNKAIEENDVPTIKSAFAQELSRKRNTQSLDNVQPDLNTELKTAISQGDPQSIKDLLLQKVKELKQNEMTPDEMKSFQTKISNEIDEGFHAKDAQQLENIIQSELQNLSDQSKLDKDLNKAIEENDVPKIKSVFAKELAL